MPRTRRLLPPAAHMAPTPLHDLKRQAINPDIAAPPAIEPGPGRVSTVSNDSPHGAIRANLRGREPAGVAAAGTECREPLDAIAVDLAGLRSLEPGGPIVAAIHRCDDLCPGPERDHLRDRFVASTGDAPMRGVGPNRLPCLDGEYRYVRNGAPRPDGMFIVKTPLLSIGADAASSPRAMPCRARPTSPRSHARRRAMSGR